MRGVNTLSTVGTTNITLGEAEFLYGGERVVVKAADSVATATLRITVNGNEVFNGPIGIEGNTDRCVWPEDIITMFTVGGAPDARARMVATLGGTVAGARVDFLILAPGEPIPW